MPWTNDSSSLLAEAYRLSDQVLGKKIKEETDAFLREDGSGAGMWLAVLVSEAHDRGYYIYA